MLRDNTRLSSNRSRNVFDACVATICKEVKKDNRLVKQTLIAGLSAYTPNPVNLAINAPTQEGKSYAMNKVFSYFPAGDVYTLAGTTKKAIFHLPGRLVIRNEESGELEEIEPQLEEIDKELLELEVALKLGQKTEGSAIRKKMVELKLQKKNLHEGALKLVDLQHKILVFPDTPDTEVLTAIMPILSHDKFEMEYTFVDTNHGIKTRTNVLRGFPAVIFSQALDLSKHPRYQEISRRFIITSPAMEAEKYREATVLTSQKLGLPDLAYQRTVISDEEKHQVGDAIVAIKNAIIELTSSVKPGKNTVLIPYADSIQAALPSGRAKDMTTSNRFFTYNGLLPIINSDKRPKIKVVDNRRIEDGVSSLHTRPMATTFVPIATYEDLEETMRLMEYANSGLRPYQADWYSAVFLSAFSAKTAPDTRETDGEKREESIIAVTTRQLIEETREKMGKTFTSRQLLDAYIYPLLNNGIIDQADSQLDRRAHIYYPVLSASENIKLFDFDESNSFGSKPKLIIKDPTKFPDKQSIISKIRQILQYHADDGIKAEIVDENGEQISVEALVDRYFSEPDRFFRTDGAESDHRNRIPSSMHADMAAEYSDRNQNAINRKDQQSDGKESIAEKGK